MTMFPSVSEAFPRVTKPLEGCVLWPYLDVFGLATVGYGCLVDSIDAFRKPKWSTKIPTGDVLQVKPPDSMIDVHRARLKASHKALHFKMYEPVTPLRLTQDAADALLDSRANEFASYMAAHYFADWDTWPADAQLAWMLIAWACGSGCPAEFKTACMLAKQRRWHEMRQFSKINPGKLGTAGWNPGVVPRNAQIDLCLANAAAIDNADGYATPALYWPGHVLDSPATIADTMPAAALAASALASYDVNAADCGLTGSCHLPLAA